MLLMTYADMFYLVAAGEGRWLVRHQITDVLAGRVVRTSNGFLLTDADTRRTEVFPTIDDALRGLYALA
ncbi:hypothetical protein BH11ACT4_BH11ACT4_21980 [soil metagenome]